MWYKTRLSGLMIILFHGPKLHFSIKQNTTVQRLIFLLFLLLLRISLSLEKVVFNPLSKVKCYKVSSTLLKSWDRETWNNRQKKKKTFFKMVFLFSFPPFFLFSLPLSFLAFQFCTFTSLWQVPYEVGRINLWNSYF